MQFKEYLGRAEELKALLSGQQPVTATPAGAAAQKARGPPGKPNGGGGEGGGGDVRQTMLASFDMCQLLLVH